MTWKNSNYSSSDMMSMQRDAVRRVKEMQRIANSRVYSSPTSEPKRAGGHSPNIPTSLPPKQESNRGEKKPSFEDGNPISGLLSQLNLDSDRLIILILLIVLMNEGADQKMLLALCYLLL